MWSAAYCPKNFTDNYNSTDQIKEGEWRVMEIHKK